MNAAALAAYLDRVPSTPFRWDEFNCAHFVSGWVHAATGRDPMAGIENRSAAHWLRMVRAGGGLRRMVNAALGAQPLADVIEARAGDVVLLPGTKVGALGICAGKTVVCIDDDGAFVYMPLAAAVAAWRLPESAA